MRKARKFMSLALSAAMVVGMAATTPVMAEDAAASEDGYNLSLCIASEPMSIDPALNSAVDGAITVSYTHLTLPTKA